MFKPKLTHTHTYTYEHFEAVTHHALWQLLGAPGAQRGQSPKSVNIARHLAAARQRAPNPSSRKQLTAAAKPPPSAPPTPRNLKLMSAKSC